MSTVNELLLDLRRLQNAYRILRQELNEQLIRRTINVMIDGEQKIATVLAIDMNLWETKVYVYFDRNNDPSLPSSPWSFSIDDVAKWNAGL